MKALCYATVTGKSISIEVINHPWYITIRRVGDKRFDPFFAFDQEEASASDIEVFIPNWSRLSWLTLPVNDFEYPKSIATDRLFSIELNGSDTYQCQTEVINSFLTFMGFKQ